MQLITRKIFGLDRLRGCVNTQSPAPGGETAKAGGGVPSQGIDTSAGSMNPASKLQLNVLAAVAEFERDLIRERTKAGMKAAKARGVKFGRETVVTGAQRSLAQEILQHNPDTTVTSLSKRLGFSLGTPSRLKVLINRG